MNASKPGELVQWQLVLYGTFTDPLDPESGNKTTIKSSQDGSLNSPPDGRDANNGTDFKSQCDGAADCWRDCHANSSIARPLCSILCHTKSVLQNINCRRDKGNFLYIR